jgi:hypothetical protein
MKAKRLIGNDPRLWSKEETSPAKTHTRIEVIPYVDPVTFSREANRLLALGGRIVNADSARDRDFIFCAGIFEVPVEEESLWLKTVKIAERDLKTLEEIARRNEQGIPSPLPGHKSTDPSYRANDDEVKTETVVSEKVETKQQSSDFRSKLITKMALFVVDVNSWMSEYNKRKPLVERRYCPFCEANVTEGKPLVHDSNCLITIVQKAGE